VVLLLATETLAARPHFIPFFNVLAGGTKGGINLLSDSNLDWGQGLPVLRRWMAARGVEKVNLCYFGTADPAAYGISFVPLAGSYRFDVPGAGVVGYPPQRPELPGYVAIGATNLQASTSGRRCASPTSFSGGRPRGDPGRIALRLLGRPLG